MEGAPPYIAGYEGAGVVVESKSRMFRSGDAVAFADVPFANAEYVLAPETHLIPLPNDVDCLTAASMLLQGLTAHYLSTDSHDVQPNELVVIHAASGGVGQILTQICKMKGAVVIGLTRNENKLETIESNGADYALILDDDWRSQIKRITDNRGVDVAYDSVGSTLAGSIEVTKDCGHIVFCGMSGGDPDPVDPRALLDTSKTLTGGDLWSYLTSHEERIRRAHMLFDGNSSGKILLIPDSYTQPAA